MGRVGRRAGPRAPSCRSCLGRCSSSSAGVHQQLSAVGLREVVGVQQAVRTEGEIGGRQVADQFVGCDRRCQYPSPAIAAIVVTSLAAHPPRWVAVDLSFPIHPRLRFAVCPSRLVPRSSVFPALMLFLSRASGCFHVWRPWHRRSRAPPLPAQRGPRARAVIRAALQGAFPARGDAAQEVAMLVVWGHEVSRFAPPPHLKSHRNGGYRARGRDQQNTQLLAPGVKQKNPSALSGDGVLA